MATRNSVIQVEPDLAEAFRSAPAEEQRLAKAAMRNALRLVSPVAEPTTPHLTRKESELFLKINNSLSDDSQRKFDKLTVKRRRGALTRAERKELLQLTEESEQIWQERIRAISELAKLRRTTPDELMESLGIQRRNYE